MFPRSIPSPAQSYIEIGPLTIHFYALCIISGIAIAIWLGDRRFRAHDPQFAGVVADVAIIAVPSGIIGGRLYHVITSPDEYFGEGGHVLDALKIWKGGLGIWGAISVGVLGAYFAYRARMKKSLETIERYPSFTIFLDALAPGVLLAQAIGRFGNWFNKELFGSPLDTWWGLEIPPSYRPTGFSSIETFHPTFAYEAIWCALLALALILLKDRFAPGAIFSLYIAGYCLGRFFIEGLRIDQAHLIGGIRINQWVSIFVGVIALSIFARLRRRSGRL
jgi:prolipoprotein diacylglyceryl transferase